MFENAWLPQFLLYVVSYLPQAKWADIGWWSFCWGWWM